MAATTGSSSYTSPHPRIVMLGPPGSGKGTHARLLADRLSVPHVSTGELLRREIEAGSPLGREVEKQVRDGSLVSDRIVLELVEATLRREETSRGWILDGAPRNVEQAALLAPLIEGQEPATVIALDVGEAELRRRLGHRRSEEGRPDDAPAVVDDRLQVWEATGPLLLEYYEHRGLLVRVDGAEEIPTVAERLVAAVGRLADS